MADIVIGLEAQDRASKVFVDTGKSAEEMGKRTERGAKKAKEALEEQGRTVERTTAVTEKGSRVVERGAKAAKEAIVEQRKETEKLEDAVENLAREQESASVSVGKLAAGVAVGQLAFEAGARAVDLFVGFVKTGVESMLEAERSERQLASALDTLGYSSQKLLPALVAQADAFESMTFATSEQVQEIQQLLLRFGVAPRDIQKTTAAILDYASATGKSAKEAAMALVKGLDSGGESLRELGVHMKTTGDRSRDLGTAVEQMAAKFGGTAAAEADGLGGKLDRLKKSQDKLGESFAGFIANIDARFGILDTLISKLGYVNQALDPRNEQRLSTQKELLAAQEKEIKLFEELAQAEKVYGQLAGSDPRDVGRGDYSTEEAKAFQRMMGLQQQASAAERARIEIEKKFNEIDGQIRGVVTAGASNTATELNKGTEKIVKAVEDRTAKVGQAIESGATRWTQGVMSLNPDSIISPAEQQRAVDEWIDREQEVWEEAKRKREAIIQQALAPGNNRIGQLTMAGAQGAAAQGAPAMEQAGIAVGQAFISGLDSQLSQIASGGDFDIGQMLASLIPMAVTALLTATGVGAPVAGLAGAAAGVLVKAGMGAGAKGGKFRAPGGTVRYHSGGYVDDRPRFHDGGLASDEVDAVLQKGEYVVPRGDVARMGGPRGVERATRGGGQMHVYVSTLDSQSFSEFMGDRGGSGLTRTLIQNRGEFAQKLRRAGVRG